MWTGRSFADLLGRQIRFRFEQSPLIYFYHLPSLSRSFFVKTLYTDFSSALLGRGALKRRNGRRSAGSEGAANDPERGGPRRSSPALQDRCPPERAARI